MITYKAFGLYLNSTVEIAQLQPIQMKVETDLFIHDGDLTFMFQKLPPNIYSLFRKEEMFFVTPGVGSFLIKNGTEIIFQIYNGVKNDLLSAYLMGPCMGAILHQRELAPLHGSCVSDGKRAVLITGESGAGKSTLAAEFLAHGWKLLTDDVAAVHDIETMPMVQPSYPSQKLWQDSLRDSQKDAIHSLYSRQDGTKFGVDVTESFSEMPSPLSVIVRLLPQDAPCKIQPIEGMTKVNELMRNTYNSFMIVPEKRKAFFQRCVTLSTKVPMVLLTRENGTQCATKLYELLIAYLEKGEKE